MEYLGYNSVCVTLHSMTCSELTKMEMVDKCYFKNVCDEGPLNHLVSDLLKIIELRKQYIYGYS